MTGIPFIFVVQFDDYIGVADMSDLYIDAEYYPRVKMGGRDDRGDWQDTEPVIHIPTNKFLRLDI